MGFRQAKGITAEKIETKQGLLKQEGQQPPQQENLADAVCLTALSPEFIAEEDVKEQELSLPTPSSKKKQRSTKKTTSKKKLVKQ